MSTQILRVVVTAAAAIFLALVGLGGQAAAHTGLETSTPTDGEVLTAAPEAITLTFTEAVEAQFTQVAVTDADGRSVNSEPATVEGPVVRQPVGVAADGAYVVAYRVVSSDGHPITGQLTFTLTGGGGGGAGTPGPSQSSPPGGGGVGAAPSDSGIAVPSGQAVEADGGGTWWWPVLVLGAVSAGVALLVLRRRSVDHG